jgi:hypothetical protein
MTSKGCEIIVEIIAEMKYMLFYIDLFFLISTSILYIDSRTINEYDPLAIKSRIIA